MSGSHYAFQNDSGSQWSRALTSSNKWIVQTSSGVTVDFYTRNFDSKHIKIISGAATFASLQTAAQTTRDARKNGTLKGHGNSYISPSGTNTTIALSKGNLAAWGGDIATKQKNATATSFKGTPQWHISSELPAAALLTKNANGTGQSGLHATVEVVVEKSGSTLYVVHFEAGKTTFARSMTHGSNDPTLNTAIIATRQARFDKKHDLTPIDYDLSGMFG